MSCCKNQNEYIIKNCGDSCKPICNDNYNCMPNPSHCCKFSNLACDTCEKASQLNKKAEEFAKCAREAEQKAAYYSQLAAQECEKAEECWKKNHKYCEESLCLIKQAQHYLLKEEKCYENNCSDNCHSSVCDCITKCKPSSCNCNYNCGCQ